MAKTEVYSWRVSSELKESLADLARRKGVSISELLEKAVRAWLGRVPSGDDDREQKRLHADARRAFGAIAGGDPHRSESVRRTSAD